MVLLTAVVSDGAGLAVGAPGLRAGALPSQRAGVPDAGEGAAGQGDLVPVTQVEALDGFPDWTPAGDRLAFMRNGQVWVAGLRGEPPTPLTGEPGFWDVSPAWSPDGLAIAFIRFPARADARGPARLMWVAADGSGLRELHRDPGALGMVAWRPDGGALAFSAAGGIQVLDLARGTVRRVPGTEGADVASGGVSWSTEGQIAFAAGDERPDLWLVPAAGGKARRLTTGGGIMPHFSPDGRRIAYRNPTGKSGIYVLDLAGPSNGGTLRLADQARAMYFHPRFAPDGRSIALARLTVRGQAMISNIWIHRAAAGE